MIQEKPTSLRILQPSKKNTLAPAFYILIGLILGIILSAVVVLFFLKAPSAPTVTEEQTATEEHTAAETLPQAQPAPVNPVTETSETAHAHQERLIEQNEEELTTAEDNDFVQPKESELSKLFTHAPALTAVPSGRLTATQHKTPAKKASPGKPVLLTQSGQSATAETSQGLPSAKHAPGGIKEKEPEVELPKASLQIKVTQKPFSLDES